MKNEKIYVIAIIVLVWVCIGFGIFSYYTARTAKQLDSQARELREDLTRISRTSEQIQNNYISASEENDRLRQEIISGFSGAYDGIVVIEQGLAEIGEGISGVLSEMRAIAEKAEDPH